MLHVMKGDCLTVTDLVKSFQVSCGKQSLAGGTAAGFSQWKFAARTLLWLHQVTAEKRLQQLLLRGTWSTQCSIHIRHCRPGAIRRPTNFCP